MDYLVTDEGLRLASRADGPEGAPTLVFANSLGTTMQMWDLQVAALGQTFRVVRYDMRGQGRSDVPFEPPTMERLGQDFLALLDHYAIRRAHVCGLSLGGMVAIWTAAAHPERIDRAIFANTGARIGSVESWTARIEAVRMGGMLAVREAVLRRFFSETFRARHPSTTQEIKEILTSTSPIGYISLCTALRDADLHPLLSHIRARALIISSELDQATPPALSIELHSGIRGSELVVLPETAHLSNVEQSDLFSAHLLEFLTRA